MKLCSGCRVTLPVAEFGRNRAKADGFDYLCKPCRRRQDREKRLGPTVDARLFPIDTLLVAMGSRLELGPGDSRNFVRPVHEVLGVNKSSVSKWRSRGGMRWPTADRVACAAGFHPSDIWPGWYDVPDAPNGDAL